MVTVVFQETGRKKNATDYIHKRGIGLPGDAPIPG